MSASATRASMCPDGNCICLCIMVAVFLLWKRNVLCYQLPPLHHGDCICSCSCNRNGMFLVDYVMVPLGCREVKPAKCEGHSLVASNPPSAYNLLPVHYASYMARICAHAHTLLGLCLAYSAIRSTLYLQIVFK